MELYLIVPVPEGSAEEIGDEIIDGRSWRVTGPHDTTDIESLKFYCISYVWGPGTVGEGSFFNCKRPISDQTRPALEAAMKAARVVQSQFKRPVVEAFWIDAICIPQLETPARFKTLESMGFIYAASTCVLIVLQPSIWKIIKSVSSEISPRSLTHEEMQILEQDKWISRVWTYQELVNGSSVYFTTLESSEIQGHAIDATTFFDCIGFSLARWKLSTGKPRMAILEEFPHLNTLEDTLVDRQLGDYLERTALGVLSNMALRQFDPQYPQNRLLACLGALTQECSWGPPSTTIAEISEKLMGICEQKGDYSFIYTGDLRSTTSGMRWRPDACQPDGRLNLVPVANWHAFGTQDCRKDARGVWLEKMVQMSRAESIDESVEVELDKFLYGDKGLKSPNANASGIFRRKEREVETLSQVLLKYLRKTGIFGVRRAECEDDILSHVLLRFLRKIGFSGDGEPLVCKRGLFFSQVSLKQKDSVEIYVSCGIRWVFGGPGLARWKEGGEMMYCAGIFTGIVKTEATQSLLLE